MGIPGLNLARNVPAPSIFPSFLFHNYLKIFSIPCLVLGAVQGPTQDLVNQDHFCNKISRDPYAPTSVKVAIENSYSSFSIQPKGTSSREPSWILPLWFSLLQVVRETMPHSGALLNGESASYTGCAFLGNHGTIHLGLPVSSLVSAQIRQ